MSNFNYTWNLETRYAAEREYNERQGVKRLRRKKLLNDIKRKI